METTKAIDMGIGTGFALFLISTVYSVKWLVYINKTALKMVRTRETFFSKGAFLINNYSNTRFIVRIVGTDGRNPKLYARAQIIAFKCSQMNTEFNKTLDNLVRSRVSDPH